MRIDESLLPRDRRAPRHGELQRRMAALHGFHQELERTRALAQESARIVKVAKRALEMYEANFAGGARDALAAELRPADRVPAG